ncbi:hypothetical protein AC579_3505 [Pseudocercospora musae]|uniref:Uncharacterized protein n=1 Tax=Pseudocercospora musae TaxID=113226 RepID=A0A139I3C7_9PEZI|nr:hypothetical protein AC579_3505 [Pseudocercospora musae]
MPVGMWPYDKQCRGLDTCFDSPSAVHCGGYETFLRSHGSTAILHEAPAQTGTVPPELSRKTSRNLEPGFPSQSSNWQNSQLARSNDSRNLEAREVGKFADTSRFMSSGSA